MPEWTSFAVNDPARDYDLIITIMEGSEHRADIERDAAGELVLTVYPGPGPVTFPGRWLAELLVREEQNLPKSSPELPLRDEEEDGESGAGEKR